MTIYYTYCSYETDKGDSGLMYIGYRKCPKNKTPWTDNYFGSQKSKRSRDFKTNPNKCKVILGLFESSEEALAHEIELHEFYDVAKDPRFANQAKQTSTGFSTAGVKPSSETIRKMSEAKEGGKNHFFGRKHSPESLQKMSENQVDFRGEKNPFFGKKHSSESLQKMSGPRPSAAGKNNPNYGKTWKDSQETKGKKSRAMAGEKHHNYDHTLYDFENKELGVVEMQVTRYQLMKKYDLLSPKVGAVVKGDRRSHKGWTLLSQDQIPDKTS